MRVWHDIHSGSRAAFRSRWFTGVTVLTLGLGIGASTAIFSVIRSLLLRPLPYPDAERLVALHSSSSMQAAPVSAPDLIDWQTLATGFDALGAFRYWGFVLTGDGLPDRVLGARVSADLLSLLGIEPQPGRRFTQQEDRFGGDRVVLLGESLWRSRFSGSEDIIGRSVTLNDQPHTIVGVFRSTPILRGAELLVPLAFEPFALQQRGTRALTVIGRLRSGVSLADARSGMAAIADTLARRHPESNAGWTVTLASLHDDVTAEARLPLFLLLAAVGAVLLIACANLANLQLARSMARRQEIALRTAIGAARSRVVVQLLTESLVPALLGGAAGVLLAINATGLLVALLPAAAAAQREIAVDASVLAFALALSVGTGIATGLMPALVASSTDLMRTIRSGTTLTPDRSAHRIRNGIVILDVALAFVLLVSASLLLRSFRGLHALDAGYVPENVLVATVSLPDARYAVASQRSDFFRTLLRVRAMPGVTAAGAVSHLPLAAGALHTDFSIQGRPAFESAEVNSARLTAVTPGAFEALRMRMVGGRPFDERDDAGAAPVVIIDETLARAHWPDSEPIGERIVVGAAMGADPRPRTIVGVAARVRADRLETEPGAAIWVPHAQNPWPALSLVVRTRDVPLALVPGLRAEVLAVDPLQPVYNVRTLEQLVTGVLAPRHSLAWLLAAFTAVALALAGIGVHAVTAQAVRSRSRELAIRSALGAHRTTLVRGVIGQTSRLVGIGVLGGAGVWLIAGRLTRGVLYGVGPFDVLTLVSSAAFLLLVGVLAGGSPAHRATADPAITLRSG
ncbi:MAG: ABC transporter permease [Gemmatimonadetes bacterium]|nr:ABC transporter permease [Gemmatimonadota bacterium]